MAAAVCEANTSDGFARALSRDLSRNLSVPPPKRSWMPVRPRRCRRTCAGTSDVSRERREWRVFWLWRPPLAANLLRPPRRLVAGERWLRGSRRGHRHAHNLCLRLQFCGRQLANNLLFNLAILSHENFCLK